MIAYHDSEENKIAIMAQLAIHRKADEIIKGQYWEYGKGCAVGCTIHSSKHSEYETRFGIPQMLARLEDCIFEGLPNGEAKAWPERFMGAVRPGADLSRVGWQFLHWLLTDNTVNPGIDDPLVRDAVRHCADVLVPLTKGEAVDESAESAASAADAASAESAAWSAESAASAANAASAESAAWCAASAAWSAARSAESAASAAYIKMSDKLVELIESRLTRPPHPMKEGDEMSTSDNIDALAGALAKAQGEMKNPKKDKTAKLRGTTKDGKSYEYDYSYSDLAAVREAVMPALNTNGIAVIQYTEVIAAGMLLHTRLMHSSGQWIESSYPIEINKPQVMGSAMSYGRRYGLSSMAGVASEDDDDGAAANDHTRPNGNGRAMAPLEPRFIYERLKNTLLKTKTEEMYIEWKERNGADIAGLPQDYFLTLQVESKQHRANFTKPAEALSQRAINADKPAMPDDAIPF